MLDVIVINNPDIESCFTAFFKQWSEREVDATWQKLIDALIATNKHALAKELTEALTSPVTRTGGLRQSVDLKQPLQQPQAVESFDQQNPQPQPPIQDNNHTTCGDTGTYTNIVIIMFSLDNIVYVIRWTPIGNLFIEALSKTSLALLDRFFLFDIWVGEKKGQVNSLYKFCFRGPGLLIGCLWRVSTIPGLWMLD